MTTATKSLSQMTTSELIQEDIRNANAMEEHAYANELEWTAKGRDLLRQRCEIRAELNRRHEASHS